MSDRPPTETSNAEHVILTGLSGSGKGTALRVFEDLDYYAVDNLPVELIPKFVELCRASDEIKRAALVVDVREGVGLRKFPEVLAELKKEAPTTLLFLTAGDEVLQRRFSETRRPHPLGQSDSVLDQIRVERDQLAPIQALADLTIDTSRYNIHDLRRLITDRFGESARNPGLLVTLESFGFKHGVPIDSDIVFDVRFLPNPHYLPGGKEMTGHDQTVIDYVSSFPQTQEFIGRVSDLLNYLIPHYAAEGKSYLTISIGCTGGRHRSVMISEEIRRRLDAAGHGAKIVHRDIAKGQ
ncbi:MAG: RNase adapter RapZ [Acidobacteria bacterium]|nr:RNase adapter RapZ [Acidobacteriota bacterium]MDA1233528.1 RNase adapter RapZ [Acidobacteriota bacterium]